MDAATAVAFAVALQDHLLAAAPQEAGSTAPAAKPAPKGRKRKTAQASEPTPLVCLAAKIVLMCCLLHALESCVQLA